MISIGRWRWGDISRSPLHVGVALGIPTVNCIETSTFERRWPENLQNCEFNREYSESNTHTTLESSAVTRAPRSGVRRRVATRQHRATAHMYTAANAPRPPANRAFPLAPRRVQREAHASKLTRSTLLCTHTATAVHSVSCTMHIAAPVPAPHAKPTPPACASPLRECGELPRRTSRAPHRRSPPCPTRVPAHHHLQPARCWAAAPSPP